MKGYRDAFHPPPPSPIHHNQDSKRIYNGGTGSGSGSEGRRSPTPTPHRRAGSSPPPRPLFDEPDIEIDLDEMAAMEEMEREEGLRSLINKNGEGDEGAPPVLEKEDDWEGLYD